MRSGSFFQNPIACAHRIGVGYIHVRLVFGQDTNLEKCQLIMFISGKIVKSDHLPTKSADWLVTLTLKLAFDFWFLNLKNVRGQ